jgi:hypothetical protein
METDFSRALRRLPLILALASAPALAADPFGSARRRAACQRPAPRRRRPACRPISASRSTSPRWWTSPSATTRRPARSGPAPASRRPRSAWRRRPSCPASRPSASRQPPAQRGVAAAAAYTQRSARRRPLLRAVRFRRPRRQPGKRPPALRRRLAHARRNAAGGVPRRRAGLLPAPGRGAALEASRLSEKAALESLNAAEARYRVGAATPADRLQARTAHAQAVLNRIGAEGAVKTAQGTLANVLGVDPTRPLALAPLPAAAPGRRLSRPTSPA